MIRRHLMALRLGLMVADGASATAIFLVASFARFGDGDGEWIEFWNRLSIDIRLAALLFAVAWVAALWYQGLYGLRNRWRLQSEALEILRATVLVAALTLSTLFIVGENGVSRLFLVFLFVAAPLVTLASRAAMRAWFTRLRSRGYNAHYMLVVGTGQLARDFAERVERRPGLGIHVIGHLAVPGETRGGLDRPILGSIEEMGQVFQARVVDEVAVCLEPAFLHYRDQVVRLAVDAGKAVREPIDPIGIPASNVHVEEFEGLEVRSFVFDQGHELGLAVKRLIDIAGSLVGLVVLSPVLLATAVAIRRRDGSPVLFRQTRVGLSGRPFAVYKFRTMVRDAEAQLDGLWARNDIVGPAIQLTDDPRTTPLGSFLRRTSLDELPQLWNVLRGDMSLVGPRPAPTVEVTKYDQWHRRRLSVRPGMTGLAQVTIRTYRNFDDRATLDMQYIDTWSIWLDLGIIARTVGIVFRRTGR